MSVIVTSTSEILKRLFDILATVAFGPLVIIIAAVIAILVRGGSGSPVVFRQDRAGRNMQPFVLYKFRTMRTDAAPFGPSPKSDTDDRLTRIGRFLRNSSLDELPQFWNVLKGDMSIVGPRPLYMDQAGQWSDRHRRRLLVRPGLTGLAQVRGRAELTIEEKLELDVQYVENFSLWLDLKIILETISALFGKKGIYEKRYSKSELTRGEGK